MPRNESPERRSRGRDRGLDKDERRHRRDDKERRRKRHRSRSRSYSRSRSLSTGRTRRRPMAPVETTHPVLPILVGRDAEAAREEERKREQEALEAEMEKRRRRIEAWQAQRRKLEERQREQENSGGHDNAGAGPPEADGDNDRREPGEQVQPEAGGWNLEDEGDLSDDAADNEADVPDAPLQEETQLALLKSAITAPFLKPGQRQQQEEESAEQEVLNAFGKGRKREQISVQPAAAGPRRPVAEVMDKPEKEAAEDEIDPLDAFMAAEVLPEVEKLRDDLGAASRPASAVPEKNEEAVANGVRSNGSKPSKALLQKRRRPAFRDEFGSSQDDGSAASDVDEQTRGGSEEDDDVEWARKVQSGKLSKSDRLGVADHSKIDYPAFRRNFYIEVPELARMTPTEVEAHRRSLDGIKVRGKDVPKPVKNWNQCGLSARVLEVLRREGFAKPLPIQAQALPVIMGGRDCIGIAKTGSGKTLAFVLPMLRHVKDQPALRPGEGPVALIMAPTRELITQIGKEVKRFARAATLNCTCVYGGSGVANQISELKRGTEIVVCTPGRMIDVLATGSGKITNLRRVTYLVLDEADRMFDMGFEPQIMRIVNNIRPDRQTVLFSATFPRSVETLARQVLINPVEIQVGGRSVVNPDITQFVEIRGEEDRFLRLLELLGEWYDRGKVLIFVGSQDRCDSLFRDLLRSGYPCLSLHGGKDQSDRESTIADFKSAVCNVLVATSVAARGLDVKDLVLVVNYDCPNHHEDYVHRVGRTGRAGAKGTAVTFIAPDEDQYAPDLVKALKESGAPIPGDLAALAEGFERKRKAGAAKAHGSGFGGSGFKFDEAEDAMIRARKKAAAREFGVVEESESEEEGIGEEEELVDQGIREVRERRTMVTEAQEGFGVADVASLPEEMQSRIKTAQAIAEKFASGPMVGVQQPGAAPSLPTASVAATAGQAPGMVLAAAQAAAQRLTAQMAMPQPAAAAAVPGQVAPNIAAAAAAALQAMGVVPTGGLVGGVPGGTPAPTPIPQAAKHFEAELGINDFPQNARWKVTHRETIRDIGEQLGAGVVVKGRYFKPGAVVPEGERKLYLHIFGPSAEIVRRAKEELKRLVEESTEKAMRRDAPAAGRYTIL